jgi:BclB C-terminal domain-containing protein
MKKTFLLSLLTFITVTFSFAQNVGINADGSLPNSSAMLDVKSANKGLLIPRVALTGTGDVTTIPSPATSLMVYNTASAGTGSTAVVAGYYYWNGTAWVRIVTSTTAANTTYKTLIPFASGASFILRTAASGLPEAVGIIGFGNSSTITYGSSLDLTFGPNYAFVVPSSGVITDISGLFSYAPISGVPFSAVKITCRVYVSTSATSNMFLNTGASVTLAPDVLGFDPPGKIATGTLSGLNLLVSAGSRIMLVVEANELFGGGHSISGYFSGGVNMVIQ